MQTSPYKDVRNELRKAARAVSLAKGYLEGIKPTGDNECRHGRIENTLRLSSEYVSRAIEGVDDAIEADGERCGCTHRAVIAGGISSYTFTCNKAKSHKEGHFDAALGLTWAVLDTPDFTRPMGVTASGTIEDGHVGVPVPKIVDDPRA